MPPLRLCSREGGSLGWQARRLRLWGPAFAGARVAPEERA
jgi:hypothetical protein